MAEVLQGADERVADDGGAQVADVHLLGHVGSRVVDGDGLPFLGGYAETAVEARHLRGDPLGAQPDVDETGTADLRLAGDAVEVEVLDDPLGDVSRLVAEPLAQRERGVGLEVGELARPDDGVGVGVLSAESLLEGALETLGQHGHRTRHACQAIGGSIVGRMPIVTQVKVRQPADQDLVATSFVVAGIGAGFEGTIGLRVLDSRRRVLAQGSAQSAGGMAGVGEFSTTLTFPTPPRAGTKVVLQVFGDNPGLPDEGPRPLVDLQKYGSSSSPSWPGGSSTASSAATR